MHFIDEATIAGVLSMQDLIPVMRQTMIDFSRGRIDQPPRRMSAVQPHGGFLGSMPAASAHAVGAKLVTFYPDNISLRLWRRLYCSGPKPANRW